MSLALKICTKFLLQERLQVSFEEQQKQNPISHKARLKNQGMSKRNHLPKGDYKLLELDFIQTKIFFSNNKNCINQEAYNNNQTPSQLPNSD